MESVAYSRRVITEPVELAVSVADLRAHARIDTTDEDATELPRLIRAATAAVEAECRGICIIARDIELLYSVTPDKTELALPDRPIVPGSLEVGSYDEADVYAPWVGEPWEGGFILDPYAARVMFAGGTYGWPVGERQFGGTAIRYRAGFAETTEDVPDGLAWAVLQLATYWYDRRDAEGSRLLPQGVRAACDPFRRFDLGR